jgi:hypothetical protein
MVKVAVGPRGATRWGSHVPGFRRSLDSVAGLVGEEPTDPPGWFDNVSPVTRDEVEMGVGDRLAGHLAAVDPEVDSLEAEFHDEPVMKVAGQDQHLPLFIRRQVEELWLVATGDDEHVALTDRVGIRERHCQRCAGRNLSLLDPLTERALIRSHLARLRRNQSSTPRSW